jgi:hypothetical protein
MIGRFTVADQETFAFAALWEQSAPYARDAPV